MFAKIKEGFLLGIGISLAMLLLEAIITLLSFTVMLGLALGSYLVG